MVSVEKTNAGWTAWIVSNKGIRHTATGATAVQSVMYLAQHLLTELERCQRHLEEAHHG